MEASESYIGGLVTSMAKKHFIGFKKYLVDDAEITNTAGHSRSREAMALLREAQLEEFSTNVYDEMKRRNADDDNIWKEVTLHSAMSNFNSKRQRARQDLAKLPDAYFHKLVSDLCFEIRRRYPETIFDDDIPFLSYSYFDSLPANTFDPSLARIRFDKLSTLLAAPTGLRILPQQQTARLTGQQVLDIADDICDELNRRSLGISTVNYRDEYHRRRNEAREIISTLPISHIEDLARDIWCEFAKRFPEFTTEVSSPLHIPRPAPITLLPIELLSIIFEYTQDEEALVNIRNAIVCSHVCHFWRNTAMYTTSIWTNIDLRHGGCETFVARTAILPVKLSMAVAAETEHKRRQPYYSYARPLWLHTLSHRVQSISLHGPRGMLENILSCLDSDLGSLVSLDVDFKFKESLRRSQSGRLFHLHAPGLRANAPNLRKLHLRAVRMDLAECKDIRYLHLHLVSLPAAELISLLRRSPHLRELVLVQVELEQWDALGYIHAPVIFPHIEMLHLQGLKNNSQVQLLRLIRVPSSAPLFNVALRDGSRPLPIYAVALRIG